MSTADPREQQQRPSGASSEPASPASTAGASSTTPSANRASSSTTSTAAPTSTASTPAALRPRTASPGGGGAALGIAALVLGLLLGAFGMKLVDNAGDDGDGGNVLAGHVDEARYQAVILTNDKVYFGRLTEVNDTFFRLDDAFFLRETRESAEAEPVRALLPINRELHAPENSILIRQDEVVLVENLDKESPLLEEIERQTGENGSEPSTSDSGEP